jgi:hypothetical protein
MTPWCRSAIFSRNHDHVAKTSRADHCRAPCYSTSPTIKRKPFVNTSNTKPHILPSSTSPSLFVLLRLVFGQHATSPPFPSAQFLAEQAVPPSLLMVRIGSSEVGRRKNSSHAATHDSVHGGVRVASLDVGRDVSFIASGIRLLLVFHVHIHRPLPHEGRWGSEGCTMYLLSHEFLMWRSASGYAFLPCNTCHVWRDWSNLVGKSQDEIFLRGVGYDAQVLN